MESERLRFSSDDAQRHILSDQGILTRAEMNMNHRSVQSDPGTGRPLGFIMKSRSLLKPSRLISLRYPETQGEVPEKTVIRRTRRLTPRTNNNSRRNAIFNPEFQLYNTNVFQLLGSNSGTSLSSNSGTVFFTSSPCHKQSNSPGRTSASLTSSTASLCSDEIDSITTYSDSTTLQDVSEDESRTMTLSRRNSSGFGSSDTTTNPNRLLTSSSLPVRLSTTNMCCRDNTEDQFRSKTVAEMAANFLEQTEKLFEKQHTLKNLVASSSNVNESDEEEEEYAISDVWKFDPANDIGRWSRLNSVATSTIDEENISSSISDVASHSAGEDVFMVQKASVSATKNANNLDDETRSKKSSDKKSKIPFNKSQSFLKKVGSDLKKLRGSSFRKKEGLKKLVISDPVLTCGQDRVNQMNCLSIETRSHPVRKDSSQSLISSSSSGLEEASCSTVGNSSRYFCSDQSEQSFILLSSSSSFPTSHFPTSKPKPVSENVFLTPSDHVPGTFPITIRDPNEEPITQKPQSIGSISSSSSSPLTERQSSCDIIESMKNRNNYRPSSFYDNLPDDDGATAQELLDLLQSPAPNVIKRTDNFDQTAFTREEFSNQQHKLQIDQQYLWNYDEIVNASNNLQNMVKNWEQDLQVSTNKTKDQNISSSFSLPATNYKKTLPAYIDVNKVNSKQDENLNPNKRDDTTKGRSLFSWQNFSSSLKNQINTVEKDATNIQPVSLVYIHELSAGQLMMLRRLSLLKLTALMESYAPSNNKNAGWSLPRFIRKVKIPDYKDKRVFGVPLIENVRENGKALPPCILQALIYLRQTSLKLKGIFRKPGVKSRITKLRCCCESTGKFNLYDDCSAYDVADMVKQYFRELPDSLMTSKLNDTFVGIFLHVPENLRLQTLQAAVMLLPDENREALMTLLCFLNCIASNSSENQMTSSNLATCFAPSLFCFQSRNSQTSVSPKSRKTAGNKSSSQHLSSRFEQREKDENLIANKCILFMIDNVHLLFMLPEDTMTQCRISVMQQIDDVLGAEIGFSTPEIIGCETTNQAGFLREFHSYVDRIVSQGPRDEHRALQIRNTGWHNNTTINGCEVMCKKINDGNPLRLWRCKIDGVKAPVKRVLERILHERQLWDKDLCEWKVIQQPDEKTQLFQIVSSEMHPHPTRDFCVLRSWRNDVTTQGGAAVVEISAGQNIPMIGDVRGVMLTSRYFIEPSTNSLDECSITRICRVDMKGRNPEWYNKTYGHRVCLDLLRIRNSFTSDNSS